MSHVTLTDTGFTGRDGNGKKFKLTFDQIEKVEAYKHTITLYSTIQKKNKTKNRVYEIANAKNAEEIYKAYEVYRPKTDAAPEAAPEA